jgi:hypothetical protein
MNVPQNKSYTTGHFVMVIDGHKTSTYLKSVEGGWPKPQKSTDAHGGGPLMVNQLTNFEYEPISIEFGAAGATQVLQWIQGSWNRKYGRRNGQINHADFTLKSTFEHEFFDALITETTFPALDGASKDPSYIKCKIVPEGVKLTTKAGAALTAESTGKQKLWSNSAFRLTIDQVDGMEYTNKIESFTIKQGTKKVHVGAERYPQIEPTKVEFPTLSGTIALGYADKLLKWHKDYIVSGKRDQRAQFSGSLDFLSPDRKSTIFRINLYEVGLLSASIQQSTANADQIKRVKFELFVNSMKLDGPGALGLE